MKNLDKFADKIEKLGIYISYEGDDYLALARHKKDFINSISAGYELENGKIIFDGYEIAEQCWTDVEDIDEMIKELHEFKKIIEEIELIRNKLNNEE